MRPHTTRPCEKRKQLGETEGKDHKEVQESTTEVAWTRKEARPRIRRKKDSGNGTTWEKKGGSPNQRWIGCVNWDMRAIGTAKDDVNDRTGWRRIVSAIRILTVTNRFRLLPSGWGRRFSPWQPSLFCQWPSLGWCHRCACHISVCQAISFLAVLWVGFPSLSYVVCFLLCASRHIASHAHTI